MPSFHWRRHDVYYEWASQDEAAPTLVFINGLTQATHHWAGYRDYFHGNGFQVLTYDLLGQGGSSKPVLDISFDDNTDMLADLLSHLGVDKAYVSGISFGGVVALRFGIRYPDRLAGLIPMSTFSQMDGQLKKIGENLYTGMSRVGFEFLVDMFTAYNFTDAWIEQHEQAIPGMKRASMSINDVYAIQNLMESLAGFKPFTDELEQIGCPTLILNGEFDALTPRRYHELMRQHIPHAALVLMPEVCHAFTLEIPALTCRVIEHFIRQVEQGAWEGDKGVFVAEDGADTPLTPCAGDHTRAIPVHS